MRSWATAVTKARFKVAITLVVHQKWDKKEGCGGVTTKSGVGMRSWLRQMDNLVTFNFNMMHVTKCKTRIYRSKHSKCWYLTNRCDFRFCKNTSGAFYK